MRAGTKKEKGRMIISEKEFDKQVVESRLPVIVIFYSEWSGISHLMDPIFTRLGEVYGGQISFVKIDIEQNLRLKESFGIYELPTIVFFKKGQIKDVLLGITSEKELVPRILNLLRNNNKNI